MTTRGWMAVLLLGSLGGCVWISEEEIARFNDRDGDGLDHVVDCDDGNGNVKDTVPWYPDLDEDGFGDRDAQPKQACPNDPPAGYVQDATDCDDNNPMALPGGVEVCDLQNFDEDCDGDADDADADATGKVTWYADDDGDSFGDETDPGVLACDPPGGTEVLDNADCDDGRSDVNPDGTEICDPNDVDEDCNGFADDFDVGVDPNSRIQYYDDNDGDGYGDPNEPGLIQCETPGAQAPNNADCNDNNGAINPGAQEVCDPANVDEDCDVVADDADPSTSMATMTLWYEDVDGDGYGDENDLGNTRCDPSGSEVLDSTDCDDSRPDVNPGELEICDPGNTDEDCQNGANDLDPNAIQLDWWPDMDGDGFGADGPPATTACIGPPDHVNQPGDCDDNDDTRNPDAHEYHDGIDSDCDVFATDYVCGQAYLRVGAAQVFTTIQAAINAFNQVTYCDGDTIEVLPGVYVENLTIADKSPNLVGLVGPASTVIQGTGSGRVVTIDRSSTWMSGFTVTGGNVVGDGGGVRVFYGDGVVLENLVVEGNTATNGGGIDLRNPTSVSVIDSEVSANTATTGDGGGIRISATGDTAAGVILLANLVVDANTAGDAGGGVEIDLDHLATGVSVAIEDVTLSNNDAITAGGLHALQVPALGLLRVDVIGNTGAANFGGIQIDDAPAVLEDVMLQANQGVTVGAMQIQTFNNGGATLRDVTVLDNVITQTNGHGVLLKGDAVYGSVLERVEVGRTLRAAGAPSWGSGLAVEGKVTATNLLIYDETGPSGLYLAESASGIAAEHRVTNATVVGCDHDGIRLGNAIATNLSLLNVISAHNGEFGVNQQLLVAAVGSTVTYGNAADYGGTNHVGVNGNFNANPTFVSWSAVTPSASWNLRLAGGSPCVDAGVGGVLDADGTLGDIGAYGGPGGVW